jgi:anaerobic selenocysteine-containing dehydrogenase
LSLDATTRARALYHPRPTDPVPTARDAGLPVKALIVYNCNPAAVAPDQAAVIAGLQRTDLFTVVLEHFQTDTADYADYILPATTQLEHWDLQRAYGHTYWLLNQPAIAPVGESLANSEIFRQLAHALGYTEPCFSENDETILRQLVEQQQHPNFQGITWTQLLADGYIRLQLPTPNAAFAHGIFPTPSGKCEFYSEQMAHDGYDPLPTYTPPAWQSEQTERHTEGYEISKQETCNSLVCISPPAHSFLNSSFANIDRFRQREDQPLLLIHPDDAAPRQITTGEQVTVTNPLGSVLLRAKVTTKVVAGTVLAPGVWWSKFSPDGRNINQITPQAETDMGASATFYDTLVTVELAVNAKPGINAHSVAVL